MMQELINYFTQPITLSLGGLLLIVAVAVLSTVFSRDFRDRIRNRKNTAKPTPEDCWTTADGKMIPYKDLSDSHLLNIRNMLYRNGRGELLPKVNAEIQRRRLEPGKRSDDSGEFPVTPVILGEHEDFDDEDEEDLRGLYHG